jgi:hypothetical protein
MPIANDKFTEESMRGERVQGVLVGLTLITLGQGQVGRTPASPESNQGTKPVAPTAEGKQSADTATAVEPPPLGEFRLVPVRVHLLRAPDTAANTRLTKDDISRIFKKVNGIWHAAGVHLWVESIVSEKPADLSGHEHDQTLPDDALLKLRPEDSRAKEAFNVYYIGAMRPNGIFMRRDGIFVKETARLRAVPGGIDEPLPRVTSHELGHGMGLPHRQAITNLMASGTTGTSLNTAEVERVKHTLAQIDWVETPETFLKKAEELESKGKREEAVARYRIFVELPGASPLKERARAKLADTVKSREHVRS